MTLLSHKYDKQLSLKAEPKTHLRCKRSQRGKESLWLRESSFGRVQGANKSLHPLTGDVQYIPIRFRIRLISDNFGCVETFQRLRRRRRLWKVSEPAIFFTIVLNSTVLQYIPFSDIEFSKIKVPNK